MLRSWKRSPTIPFAVAALCVLLALLPALATRASEAAADPPATKTYTGSGVRFNYPQTWKLKEQDKAEQKAHILSFDVSTGSSLMLIVFDDQKDPSKVLQAMSQPQEQQLPAARRTEFKQWGKQNGAGQMLQGNFLNLVDLTKRIFVFNAEGRTFVVIEHIPDDERAALAPGLAALEESFQVSK
jgi:hypothetical protein